ncbi:MAG: AI-2E family transporter [Bacteroidetes bacterium]|nr:MAG: AI-2E family transporter [Bacteroidota bacterium]
MKQDIQTIRNLLALLTTIVVVYLIAVLSPLLIPLALALFIAILLQPMLAWFERKNMSFWFSISAISVVTVTFIFLVGRLIFVTGKNIVRDKETLLSQIEGKLQHILEWVNDKTELDLKISELIENTTNFLSTSLVLKYFGSVANSAGDFLGLFFITAFYLVVIIGGILRYENYIHYLEDHQNQLENKKTSAILEGFEQVKDSIVDYMKIKFLVSLFIGVFYWIVCLIFGINFSVFWGFLAFLLNFIPAIGGIIATVPPVLLALIQIDSMGMIFLFWALLQAAQFFLGNILETKMMGEKLSLNTITVMLGLVFWGSLWGLTGMFLSVPFLVLTKVIFAQFPETKIFMRLMSEQKEN